MNIFANDEDIRFLKGLDTPVKDSDEILDRPRHRRRPLVTRRFTMNAATVTRFARQLALPEVGPAGQERLGASRAVIVGDGLAAETAARYLAAAGVGTLRLVVEASSRERRPRVLMGRDAACAARTPTS